MTKTIKKRFDIPVTEPDKIFSKTFDLDKNITTVKGMMLTSDKDDLLYYRGSLRLEINKEEIFPENYESKLLMTGINVSPNGRYYDLGGKPAGNHAIKVEYKDSTDSRANFVPYRVSVYVECEAE